jgi:hypothetical protein
MGLQKHLNDFRVEVGGGGCLFLSRYIDGGGFVWITCKDGGGLPDYGNWLVVAYGADVDEIIFERWHGHEDGLFAAIVGAVGAAEAFVHPDELCRNGWPMADCDCC